MSAGRLLLVAMSASFMKPNCASSTTYWPVGGAWWHIQNCEWLRLCDWTKSSPRGCVVNARCGARGGHPGTDTRDCAPSFSPLACFDSLKVTVCGRALQCPMQRSTRAASVLFVDANSQSCRQTTRGDGTRLNTTTARGRPHSNTSDTRLSRSTQTI